MKDVIHDNKIVLNPAERKIPVRLKKHLSVSGSFQIWMITRLQTVRNAGQSLFCFLKITQHTGSILRILLCKQLMEKKLRKINRYSLT